MLQSKPECDLESATYKMANMLILPISSNSFRINQRIAPFPAAAVVVARHFQGWARRLCAKTRSWAACAAPFGTTTEEARRLHCSLPSCLRRLDPQGGYWEAFKKSAKQNQEVL